MKKVVITWIVVILFQSLSMCCILKNSYASDTITSESIDTQDNFDIITEDGSIDNDLYQTDSSNSDQSNMQPSQDAQLKTETELIVVPNCTTGTVDCPQINVVIREKLRDNLPDTFNKLLKYSKYPMALNYIFTNSKKTNIYRIPDALSKVIKTAKYHERIAASEIVDGSNPNGKIKKWYRVYWWDKNGNQIFGYIPAQNIEERKFQFDNMASSIMTLQSFTNQYKIGYVNNYKNRSGSPPKLNGQTIDSFGTRRDQAAPLYYNDGVQTGFRYLPDGGIVGIEGETDTDYIVRTPNFAGDYRVPKKYISLKNKSYTDQLQQVIVVDRTNQNEGVFELINGTWTLVSYTLATTGGNDKYRLPTPLGYFTAIEKRSKFNYLGDIIKEIDGYAPYAIRFSGGAYIHGVPVKYVKSESGDLSDPGMREFLSSIGTTPLSHRCVRNYTSHAKFLYDWIRIANAAVIVIE